MLNEASKNKLQDIKKMLQKAENELAEVCDAERNENESDFENLKKAFWSIAKAVDEINKTK